jgi:hypothetical protein
LQVVRIELPSLRRIVQAGQEALSLLVEGDVQAHLHDRHPGGRGRRLEPVDLGEPGEPHGPRNETVYPDDEDVLVVRAVEDADLAGPRQGLRDPPQEVVAALLGRWRLEPSDLRPLRVEPADHMDDGAVLPAGVHALEHEQQGTGALRVEALLELVHALAQRVELGQRRALARRPRGGRRVDVRQ